MTLELLPSERFDDLLLAATPLLDVRAPIEFQRGSIPGASNLPLLDDEQRHAVGVRYKQAGPAAATRLGHELVSAAVRESRIDGWRRWLHEHPNAALYCFRGGQRSTITQQWLDATGLQVPRIAGGYKALRAHLIQRLELLGRDCALRVIGGRTGTGKTRILATIDHAIDLEGLANHRGSAFGRRATAQPTPIDFENQLSVRLLHLSGRNQPIVIEDESRNVGRLSVPDALLANLQASPIAIVEADAEERVQVTLEDYIIEGRVEFEQAFAAEGGEVAMQRFAEHLRAALARIRKRLGGARHSEIQSLLDQALAEQARTGDVDAHRTWIRRLLLEYYDPMYDYQLAGKQDRIQFRGTAREVREWLVAESDSRDERTAFTGSTRGNPSPAPSGIEADCEVVLRPNQTGR